MSPIEVPGYGPIPSDIVIVGEAPGQNEEIYRRPFVGEAGNELTRILTDAHFDRRDIYMTNVFKFRPEDNNVLEYFTSRTDPDACLDMPPLRPGKFLRSAFRNQITNLRRELVSVDAKVVVAMGATALWALLGHSKISAHLGAVNEPTNERPYFVLPTYHPAAVLRQWNLRTTVLANLTKIHDCLSAINSHTKLRSSRLATITKKTPTLKINPTLDELAHLAEKAYNAPKMAVDVETFEGQIRTIAFALSATDSFCVPFWEPPQSSYWPTVQGELQAWKFVARALAGPGVKIFHNGSYDIQYLWRVHGIPINGPVHDTLVAYHAMEPELPKSLGYLAAIYLDMPEWKTMRAKSEKDEE